jgi:RNA polymerase sigma-70 factor (ECF subfamily)
MDGPSVQSVQLRQWLERMRAGDLAARDDLLRALCGRLECLARKMLRRFPQVHRWAQTDDVLQNALMRLLRSLHKVQPGSVRDFFGLAALEMRRELLDLARHYYGPLGLGANHASQGGDSGQTMNDQDPAVPEDREDLERWQAFHAGVDNLPAEEREIVSLIFYHGWTQAEVAELLQSSERTIRRRWESALRRLHQRLNLDRDA